MAESELDNLAFLFFRMFARCEYCLKAVGICKGSPGNPKADWQSLAAEVRETFDMPPNPEIAEAIQYFLSHPPQKQVLTNGRLDWSTKPPDAESQAELILLLICRVRNNLFHGGKFNGHWFEPQRSEELLVKSLVILQAVIASHPKINDAYEQRSEK
ncbi:hypothetical protein ACP0I7_27550 [Pseudomonas aeruginosa]